MLCGLEVSSAIQASMPIKDGYYKNPHTKNQENLYKDIWRQLS